MIPLTETPCLPGQQLIAEIDDHLRKYAEFGPGCPTHLAAAIRHSLLAPGKRLRPLLVLLAGQACDCPTAAVMPAACAVEMIHTYSLIHDDLPAMDDDEIRRGLPTCHVAFGEATAILAGDALLARAFEIMATDLQPPTIAATCCRELAHTAGATQLVGGQADDLHAEQLAGDAALLDTIHNRKTGAMFVASVRLGGIVAQTSAEKLQALTEYGRNLGLAFQIIDDLLDELGEEDAMGKRTHKDAERGKTTYPSIYGVAASRNRSTQLIESACSALAPFGSAASDLTNLASFVGQRTH
jgi:geranylgeranyl diphosphate synthase type II